MTTVTLPTRTAATAVSDCGCSMTRVTDSDRRGYGWLFTPCPTHDADLHEGRPINLPVVTA